MSNKSQNTTLSVVNFSGRDITTTTVTDLDPYDWDYSKEGGRTDPFRPDLNFTGPLDNLNARCEREEINASANGVNFDLTFYFGNDWIRFHVDQAAANNKFAGAQASDSSAGCRDLEVYRITGTDGDHIVNNAFYIRPKQRLDNSTWMARLIAKAPHLKLNQITMPGSHDAGMYIDNSSKVDNSRGESGGGEWALTQHLSIGEQLQAGVRYFDLRVYNDNSNVQWAFHGSYHGNFYGAFGGPFEDIFSDIQSFMNGQGAGEAVFLRITSYQGHENLQKTIDRFNHYLGDFLFTPATPASKFAETPISELKGKVIPMFTAEFASVLTAGMYQYSDYAVENPKHTINTLPVGTGPTVFDLYADENAFADMQSNQQAKLTTYGGYGKEYLFLYSWTITGATGGVLDLDLLSGTANAQLPKELHRLARGGGTLPNIVHVDQAEPYLCQAIIALNG
ncbi:hypothetical protein [Andreprevotia chitinilytica]|uniref:hypothetical protein n=1 Tax=Andreprevotia chitinilytica TaxID=396808 RepID=UPI0005517721|nr:hypothetical protein [Andreprevotia chitinilytica]